MLIAILTIELQLKSFSFEFKFGAPPNILNTYFFQKLQFSFVYKNWLGDWFVFDKRIFYIKKRPLVTWKNYFSLFFFLADPFCFLKYAQIFLWAWLGWWLRLVFWWAGGGRRCVPWLCSDFLSHIKLSCLRPVFSIYWCLIWSVITLSLQQSVLMSAIFDRTNFPFNLAFVSAVILQIDF